MIVIVVFTDDQLIGLHCLYFTQWKGFKIIGDNVDKSVRARHQTLTTTDQSLHYFHSVAVMDRVDFSTAQMMHHQSLQWWMWHSFWSHQVMFPLCWTGLELSLRGMFIWSIYIWLHVTWTVVFPLIQCNSFAHTITGSSVMSSLHFRMRGIVSRLCGTFPI